MGDKPDKLLKQGWGQLRRGNVERAWELFCSACRLAHYDPEAWKARAVAAEQLGKRSDAVEALFRVADMYARAGMPQQATEAAQKVLVLDPSHGGARRFQRMLAIRTGPYKPHGRPDTEPPRRGLATTAMSADSSSSISVQPAGLTLPTPTPSEAGPPAPSEVGEGLDDYEVIVEHGPRQETTPPVVAPRWSVSQSEPEPKLVPAAVVSEKTIGRATREIALADLELAVCLPAETVDDSVQEISLEEDNSTQVLQAVAATIDASPLLSELDSDLVRSLIDGGQLRIARPGATVFAQGDAGVSLYLVLKGQVVVERASDEASGIVPLARLRPGAFFGEMALLTNAPRTATVRAETAAHLLEVSRSAVHSMIERDERVLKLLMRFFRARLVGNLLATSPLFAGFDRSEKRALVARFRLRELRPGYLVLRQDVPADGLYLVLVGKLQVFTGGAISDPHLLANLGPGDVFGEMSLLRQRPAMANIRTQGRSWVLLLPRGDFDEFAGRHPELRQRLESIIDARTEQNSSVQLV